MPRSFTEFLTYLYCPVCVGIIACIGFLVFIIIVWKSLIDICAVIKRVHSRILF